MGAVQAAQVMAFAYPTGRKIPSREKTVTLFVTRRCNLSCRYCYQSFRDSQDMSPELATRLVECELAALAESSCFDSILVRFMGGEPLLNFLTIRNTVERFASDARCRFDIQTNGTVLDDEMRRWLVAHRNIVTVLLSMDGLSAMNAFNRGSLGVDVGFFRKNWPDERLSVTLHPDSVRLLAETVVEMNEAKVPFRAAAAAGVKWTPSAVAEYARQTQALSVCYVCDYPEAVACGLYSLDPLDFFPEERRATRRYCGKWRKMAAYDVDGQDYVCHMLVPVVLGQDTACGLRDASTAFEDFPEDEDCISCAVAKFCEPCFGMHVRLCGDPARRTERDTVCAIVRQQALDSAAMFVRQFERSGLVVEALQPDDQMRLARSVGLLEMMDGELK